MSASTAVTRFPRADPWYEQRVTARRPDSSEDLGHGGQRRALAEGSPNDLREGGAWTIAQRVKNDLIFLAVLGGLLVVRLPSPLLHRIGRALGTVVWALAPRLRRTASDNVARALPELPAAERPAFVRRVYRQLGELLGEALASLDPSRRIETLPLLPGARECLDAAVAEGRGVVFASAHLGPWERVAASLVDAGVPLTVVAREPYDPRLARVYVRLRAARGVRTVYRGSRTAAVALLRVLRRGEVLGVPMDLRSRVESIEAPFLGLPALTPVGPARLAIRTGAAVVVGTATTSVTGTRGISFTRIPRSTSERELTTWINDELSARIRATPESWPWMHPRWTGLPTSDRCAAGREAARS